MNQLTHQVLQALVTFGCWLADQERRFFGQLQALLHSQAESESNVIDMRKRLAMRRIAREYMALQLAFVDTLDLRAERGYLAPVGVNASKAKYHKRDAPMMRTHFFFRRHLGFRVGPLWRQRCLLIDGQAGLRRCMHQHCAGVDKLLYFERLKRLQKPARALYVDLIVQ